MHVSNVHVWSVHAEPEVLFADVLCRGFKFAQLEMSAYHSRYLFHSPLTSDPLHGRGCPRRANLDIRV